MKVTTQELVTLLRTLDLQEVPLAISKIDPSFYAGIDQRTLTFKKTVSRDDLSHGIFAKASEFQIFLPSALSKRARHELPILFPPVDFQLPLEQIYPLLERTAALNENTPHPRELILAEDMCKDNSERMSSLSTQTHPIVLYASSRETLNEKKLAVLTKEFRSPSNISLKLAYNENTVIVYCTSQALNFPMMREITQTLNELSMPYTTLSHIEELAQGFQQNATRLTIITHSSESHESRLAYNLIKRQDPLAKILEYSETKRERHAYLKEAIKTLYHADYFSPNSGMHLNKKPLPRKQEKSLQTDLSKLFTTYNSLKHITIEYQIHKLGLHYHIDELKPLLKKLLHQRSIHD